MTNPMTTGNPDSFSAEERLTKCEEILDAYEKGIGISLQTTDEAERFLNLSRADLGKMSSEECSQGAYMLARVAAHVQKQINVHIARINWAKSNIDFAIINNLSQYGGQYATYEQRRTSAIKDNEFAMAFQKMLVQAQLRVDRLSYLVKPILTMCDTLRNMSQEKRKDRQI
jgi:hypothetical protein